MSTPNSQAPNAIKREMGGGGVSNKFSIFQDKQLKQIKNQICSTTMPQNGKQSVPGKFCVFPNYNCS